MFSTESKLKNLIRKRDHRKTVASIKRSSQPLPKVARDQVINQLINLINHSSTNNNKQVTRDQLINRLNNKLAIDFSAKNYSNSDKKQPQSSDWGNFINDSSPHSRCALEINKDSDYDNNSESIFSAKKNNWSSFTVVVLESSNNEDCHAGHTKYK